MAFFMVIGMMPVNVVRAEGTEGDGTEIVAETTAPETTPHVCDHVAVVTAPTCEAAGFTPTPVAVAILTLQTRWRLPVTPMVRTTSALVVR